VQQNLGIFDGMGQNLFRAFATILVVWYGIKASLAAGDHRGGFHFANFVALILMISFGFAMVITTMLQFPASAATFITSLQMKRQRCPVKLDSPMPSASPMTQPMF